VIAVELAPGVTAPLRAIKDRGTQPPRCRPISGAIACAARRLVDNALSGGPIRHMFGGVIVDGDRGVLLTGLRDSALVIEG